VRDEEGAIVGASKIARDITDRKRAERLLREADHRKDEFLAMLAHELRNPLAPMRNAVELLCRVEHREPEQRSACEILNRQMRQMKRLVDDLLDASRIGAGRLELEEELVDLGALLRGVENALRPEFRDSDQRFSVTLPAATLCVQGDRTRLIQVFSNVLHNAHKYTPRGGRISLNLRREADEAVVSIKDTGAGISPAMLDRVFDLFMQVDRSHRRTHGGLGIGLTLARRLLQLHNGSIEARSAGEGRGSEFVIRLPLREPATERAAAPTSPIPTEMVARRILVADDNEDTARSLGMLLEQWGHTTRVVQDGLAAVQVAEEFRPEVVILDLEMPNLDGHDAARQIADRPWAGDVLLLALTGWSQEADRTRAQRAGFHKHLVKPVEPDELREILAQMEDLTR
jgi:CheY-like chemotaxis protein/nitrogen-specific signal transduction histidine kinase